ncbi:hypothetical protein [Streptomyces sp. AS02]|uniref:hypothetical protein n=1 Tax=Streptomyces sp. AS02 TaxID=2938946 RepID=UPI00202173F3|nr:hypothetical protein [Streptomyces sp. AS02]MCL8014597.1 hypothetical protein [Streptomyces sp. AS02]
MLGGSLAELIEIHRKVKSSVGVSELDADDLRYPSMDDLVIIGDTEAHKWVTALGREERLVVASLDSCAERKKAHFSVGIKR